MVFSYATQPMTENMQDEAMIVSCHDSLEQVMEVQLK
jgi:hypothetical protein